MKRFSLFLSTGLCLLSFYARSQSAAVFSNIQVNTINDTFTVTAVNDTTFAREVVISVTDTAAFQSVQASLSLKTPAGWQSQQTASSSRAQASIGSCQQPLCLYKRNDNEWVVFLGYYSIHNTYTIELSFNGGNAQNTTWSDEF